MTDMTRTSASKLPRESGAAAGPGLGRHPLAAVLFDMDGLLVDSEPVWSIAENEVATRLGGTFTPEIKAAMIGRGVETAVPIMLSMLGVEAAARADPVTVGLELIERTVELFREPGRLVLMPGAAALLDAVAARGIPAALVSSSYRPLMDAALGVAGRDRFAVTVAGDEVERAKPYPDPYLAAIAALGMPAGACVVLEDSESGARAGLAAGCPTVLVPSFPGATTRPAGVTVVSSLEDLTVDALAGLVLAADGSRAPGVQSLSGP